MIEIVDASDDSSDEGLKWRKKMTTMTTMTTMKQKVAHKHYCASRDWSKTYAYTRLPMLSLTTLSLLMLLFCQKTEQTLAMEVMLIGIGMLASGFAAIRYIKDKWALHKIPKTRSIFIWLGLNICCACLGLIFIMVSFISLL